MPKRTGRFLTVAEFCADLGISRSTFYEWRAKHRCPPCRKLPNGALRIERQAYEAWLESLPVDQVAA
ncbi:helix-turn-helix transcriptional regulator [Actinoalloteichus hymeniacidonis]|uniref:helix-turn-helix transcriptional regulator n=1 Tax=Actinoalloteichus hymeniacidonis TaxID=340345 RepID=UPI000A032993|nr:helix-turn-helix domain-containing protein [Actinoalloteichus hymeniacidonis]